jgi:TRAP-type mannitol/chloroaromatic compound transport system permease small subunit
VLDAACRAVPSIPRNPVRPARAGPPFGDDTVNALLKLSRLIDFCNEAIGRLTMWLVLAAVLISAGNAAMRKAFDIGSNAYLEIQWYLFAAVFMLGAGYVWLKNAHVRIDFISSRLSKRTNAIIDLLIPVGFGILALQSVSELIKRAAFLTGHAAEPFSVEEEKSAEEKLAEELQAQLEQGTATPAGGTR